MSTYLRAALFSALVGTLAACGGDDSDDGPGPLRCEGGASGALAVGGTVAVTGDDAFDLRGAAVSAGDHTTVPSADVSLGCAADLMPEGYVALGPAVAIGPAGTWSDRPFDVTLPYRASLLPAGATDAAIRVVARRHVGDGTPFFPPLANRRLDATDPDASRLTIRAGELATYQVVARADAGTPRTERFAYRSIVGISMGGNAAMSIALAHPDRFDAFADLGGEPGPHMHYTLAMIRSFLFGGFCTAADEAAGVGNLGELCVDQQRAPFADQFEIGSDYDHMVYQAGEGVGLTLSRDFYMKAARDLARSFANPALYNVDDPYRPPGVPATELVRPTAERCATPLVLANFFDREFNPDGALDVITFCDGNDGATLGTIDPTVTPDNPAEILLAVDVNGNGARDPGEPILTNPHEPWADVGDDGLASVDEPGYDATTNPDPAGDDYHYQRNPRGTEGDLERQAGEPYEDLGLDGVAGTCQQGDGPTCYDVGEGDGVFTISPNVQSWYDAGIETLLAALTPAQRDHVGMWIDAGIRDMFNASVSANAGGGVIAGRYGLPLGTYDGFAAFGDASSETSYDFAQVPWGAVPRNVLLRYGDPDATEAKIEQGDGRHVGTAAQIINRVTTAFAWLDKRMPGGDRADEFGGGEQISGLTFTPSSGRESPYAVFVPPGYDKPENAGQTYPVVYFLHGYGQSPEDLLSLSAVFEIYMQPSSLSADARFQKVIIVYVDGRCRPSSDALPVDPSGDGCEQGTFYKDAPAGGPAQIETGLLELMDHIDATYRTKPAGDVQISP